MSSKTIGRFKLYQKIGQARKFSLRALAMITFLLACKCASVVTKSGAVKLSFLFNNFTDEGVIYRFYELRLGFGLIDSRSDYF